MKLFTRPKAQSLTTPRPLPSPPGQHTSLQRLRTILLHSLGRSILDDSLA